MSMYPEAEYHPIPNVISRVYEPGPRRLVLHTTEGNTVASAMAAYKVKHVAPHFTVDADKDIFVQHLNTSLAASALRNEPGGVQTNRAGRVIQIEIVGFASQSHNLPADQLKYLGKIIRLICSREGISPYNHPEFVGTDSGLIASSHAAQRFSPGEWMSFSGVCGHQHVPENEHWDPGKFPYDRTMALSAPPPAPVPPPPAPPLPLETDMFLVTQQSTNNLWIMEEKRRTLVPRGDRAAVVASKAPHFIATDALFGEIAKDRVPYQ